MTFQNGHALLIGVGADLPNTVDDARGLAEILADAERCAYPPNQVVTLTGPAASRDGMLTALNQLAAASVTNATVVVYFSGHGYQVKSSTGLQYYLMPYGYNLSALFETAVSGKEFADLLAAIPAKRLLLLLDCCHAGGVGEEKAPGLALSKAPLPPEAQSVFAKGAGRALIASSTADELSYAGRPYSAFTLALVEALAGQGVSRRDGYVRWTDLALHAREKVPQRTKDRQHPIIDLDQADNFVLGYYAGGAADPKALPFAAAPEIEPEPGAFRGASVHQQAGGDIINAEHSQGFLNRPTGPVSQHFGNNVNTGGGLYSAGNVTAGRDVVGRDRNPGLSGSDIDRLFAPLAAVIARAEPGVQAKASLAVEDLKTEVAKAEKADDRRIARLIDGLVDLVPAAIGAVTSIFTSPLLGTAAGNATRYVLDKLKT
jgi:hypothetical protein